MSQCKSKQQMPRQWANLQVYKRTFNPEPENSRQQIMYRTSTRRWLVAEESVVSLKWAPSIGIHPSPAAVKFLDNFSVSTNSSRFLGLLFPSLKVKTVTLLTSSGILALSTPQLSPSLRGNTEMGAGRPLLALNGQS